jgi:hypothetical protein
VPSRSSPRAGSRRCRLPAVDERLVAPESRYEILDGRIVHVSPAHPPHGIIIDDAGFEIRYRILTLGVAHA